MYIFRQCDNDIYNNILYIMIIMHAASLLWSCRENNIAMQRGGGGLAMHAQSPKSVKLGLLPI